MKSLKTFFTNTVLILLVIAYFVISGIMYFGKGGLLDIYSLSGMFIPDLSFLHTKEGLLSMFDAWGAQGRLYYVRYQYRDFIYPMIYTALMTGTLVRLIRPISFNLWVIVPSFAMIFDFIENYYLRILVYDYPDLIPHNISMATLFSSLKWTFIAFSLILISIAWFNRNKKYRNRYKIN